MARGTSTAKKKAKKVAKKAPKAKATKAAGSKTAKKAARKKTAKKKTAKKTAPPEEKEPVAESSPPKEGGEGLAATASRRKRSSAKRHAALEALSTSARMAEKARASVFAISSEKTLEQIQAGETMEVVAEAGRMERLAELAPDSLPPSSVRRCSRDPFGQFRTELVRPEDEATDPHAGWRYDNQRLRHEMSVGASPESLAEAEAQIKSKLPPSYYDFSLEWNGGLLFVTEGGAYRVIPASEIVDEMKGPLCDRMSYPNIPAIDLGCGDYLAFDMSKTNRSGENPLYWWYAGEPKRKVADSFALWLKRLVECDGQAFWWEL